MAMSMNDPKLRPQARRAETSLQDVVITEIEQLADATYRFTFEPSSEHALLPFDAGSTIPVFIELDTATIEQRYAIDSSPAEARDGRYRIVVKETAGGYASAYIAHRWKVGDHVVVGSPHAGDIGRHTHAGDDIVALASGMGVVPFHSMAQALAEGEANYRLTILYAAHTSSDLLFREEWAQLAKRSRGNLTMVPVLTGETDAECVPGPITRTLVERYADPDRATLFICGPGTFVATLRKELGALGLSRRRLRFSFSGDSEYDYRPGSSAVHQLTIRMDGQTHRIPARENESILIALEKAGLQPRSYCRSSICGFCRATLVSGTFILASDEEGVRKIRERFSSIHPCCSYPVSDMELVVQRAKR